MRVAASGIGPGVPGRATAAAAGAASAAREATGRAGGAASAAEPVAVDTLRCHAGRAARARLAPWGGPAEPRPARRGGPACAPARDLPVRGAAVVSRAGGPPSSRRERRCTAPAVPRLCREVGAGATGCGAAGGPAEGWPGLTERRGRSRRGGSGLSSIPSAPALTSGAGPPCWISAARADGWPAAAVMPGASLAMREPRVPAAGGAAAQAPPARPRSVLPCCVR